VFLPTALASREVGREDHGAAVTGERAEGDPDPDAAEAWPKQDGSVVRAGQPLVDGPLGANRGAPGEVFAEEGSARTLGQDTAGYRAMCEVLTLHHVRRMAAGSAEKTNVDSQGGEVVARPDGVHRLEERGLRAAQRPGLGAGRRPEEGETCQKS